MVVLQRVENLVSVIEQLGRWLSETWSVEVEEQNIELDGVAVPIDTRIWPQ